MDEIKRNIEELRSFTSDAKANHTAQGFENPQMVIDALNLIADILEKISQKQPND